MSETKLPDQPLLAPEPCPFCGNTKIVTRHVIFGVYEATCVVSETSGCGASGAGAGNRGSAEEFWNQRPNPDGLPPGWKFVRLGATWHLVDDCFMMKASVAVHDLQNSVERWNNWKDNARRYARNCMADPGTHGAGFVTVAWWGFAAGAPGNLTTDLHLHATREDASAICRLLHRIGYGGDGRYFPILTWVEPAVVPQSILKDE